MPSSILFFAGMKANSTQNSRKEIISSLHFEGNGIIPFTDRRNVLRGAGIDRAGILTPDILLKPFPVRKLNLKAFHGVFGGNVSKKSTTPALNSLRRLK